MTCIVNLRSGAERILLPQPTLSCCLKLLELPQFYRNSACSSISDCIVLSWFISHDWHTGTRVLEKLMGAVQYSYIVQRLLGRLEQSRTEYSAAERSLDEGSCFTACELQYVITFVSTRTSTSVASELHQPTEGERGFWTFANTSSPNWPLLCRMISTWVRSWMTDSKQFQLSPRLSSTRRCIWRHSGNVLRAECGLVSGLIRQIWTKYHCGDQSYPIRRFSSCSDT